MEEQSQHLEGNELLGDAAGTPCFHCPEGTYEAGATTRTLEEGDTVLVVKEVPALVCDKCGDAAFTEEVSERLEALVIEAAAAGVQFQVRRWRAPSPMEGP